MGLLQKSLKARMTAYFLLVSTMVVVALAAVTYLLAAETQKEMAIAQFDLTADHKEFEINRYLAEQTAIVTKIAGLMSCEPAQTGCWLRHRGVSHTNKPIPSWRKYCFCQRFLITAR